MLHRCVAWNVTGMVFTSLDFVNGIQAFLIICLLYLTAFLRMFKLQLSFWQECCLRAMIFKIGSFLWVLSRNTVLTRGRKVTDKHPVLKSLKCVGSGRENLVLHSSSALRVGIGKWQQANSCAVWCRVKPSEFMELKVLASESKEWALWKIFWPQIDSLEQIWSRLRQRP